MNTEDVIHPSLRISTMTLISHIDSIIDLEKVYENLSITDKITYLEYAEKPPKGKKLKQVKRRKKDDHKKRKYFYNQVTIHINIGKIVNVKIFNNGTIQMTGLKSIKQGKQIVQLYVEQLKLHNVNIFEGEITIGDFNVVLINSDFDIKYKVNRELLHRDMLELDMCSSYEPTIYPGVNMKYYYNNHLRFCMNYF